MQDCRKKQADKKYDTMKMPWKGKKLINDVEVELDLFAAIEEVCSSAQALQIEDSWILDNGA